MLIRGRKKVGTFESWFADEDFFLTLYREWVQGFQDTRKNNLIKEEKSTLFKEGIAVYSRLVPSCLQSTGNWLGQLSAKYDGLEESEEISPLSHQPLLPHFIAAHTFERTGNESAYIERLYR